MSKKDLSEKKLSEAAEDAADSAEKADEAVKDTAERTVRKFNGRWFKYSSMFYITIALVIAIVAVLNIMVRMV